MNFDYVNFDCVCDLAVSLECVSICKYPKSDGNGRYDCSPISCAWKAPRALTGLLASTAHSSVSSYGQSDRKFRYVHVILLTGFVLLGLLNVMLIVAYLINV